MRRITRLAVITAVLAAAMLLSATCVFAESGTFGKGMSWNFSDGTLTLSGTGAMPNYRNYNWDKETWGRPWEKVIEKTRTVVVGEGITRIGDNAFCRDFYKEGAKSVLSKVTLPESLTHMEKLGASPTIVCPKNTTGYYYCQLYACLWQAPDNQ